MIGWLIIAVAIVTVAAVLRWSVKGPRTGGYSAADQRAIEGPQEDIRLTQRSAARACAGGNAGTPGCGTRTAALPDAIRSRDPCVEDAVERTTDAGFTAVVLRDPHPPLTGDSRFGRIRLHVDAYEWSWRTGVERS